MTLTPVECGLVLHAASQADNRSWDESTATAWTHMIDPEVTIDVAMAAVADHYATSTRWLMPADLGAYRKKIRDIQLRRLQDAGPPEFPSSNRDGSELSLAQERDYRRLWQEQIRSGATREQATAQADTILGYKRGELVSKPVAELLGSMFSTTGRKS